MKTQLKKLGDLINGDSEVKKREAIFGISPIRVAYKALNRFFKECESHGIETDNKTIKQLRAELKAKKEAK